MMEFEEVLEAEFLALRIHVVLRHDEGDAHTLVCKKPSPRFLRLAARYW